jgi:hypothetical protein
MNGTSTIIDPSGRAIGASLYLALFRVAAIADLEGPERAVEWAQSVLDDDRLRAAFVAGVSRELGPAQRRVNTGIPLLRFGRRQSV